MENEIKIRVLPRKGEGETKKAQEENKSRRWIIYVATPVMFLAAFGLMWKSNKQNAKGVKTASGKKIEKMDLASINARINESVTRHLQDAEMQAELMRRTRELENQPTRQALKNGDLDLPALPESDKRSYGLTLDSDNAAERVFDDLDSNGQAVTEPSPSDRINARIVNRKWMNEMERNEKIQFISAFIRSAYEKGYEVEIDQNLVVVGVKKINQNKLLNIDQVIDRLANAKQ